MLVAVVILHNQILRTFIRTMRGLGQSHRTLDVLRALIPGAATTSWKAHAYFLSQRPLIEQSARRFQLLTYWGDLRVEQPGLSWYELIGRRMEMMARALRTSGRDDFLVEKDKCVMLRFLSQNALPVPQALSVVYRTREELLRSLASEPFLQDLDNRTAWPIFLKNCHLTQGSMSSVLVLRDRAWVDGHGAELDAWTKAKWHMHADDWERPWAAEGNFITGGILPGLMLQGLGGCATSASLRGRKLRRRKAVGRASTPRHVQARCAGTLLGSNGLSQPGYGGTGR